MDVVLEDNPSVPSASDGVSVGNPEMTGVVSVLKLSVESPERTEVASVLKLVCWEATVSSVLLTLGVDDDTSTSAIPEESIRAEEMVAGFVVAIRSRDVDLDGS